MQLNKSRIFLVLSVSFIIGVFIASFFNSDALPYFLLVAMVIVLTVGYRNKTVLVIIGAVLLFLFGGWKTNAELGKVDDLDLGGKNISTKSIIIKEPENKGDYQKLIVKTENRLKVLVNANNYPKISYGDELDLSCTLEVPENFSDDFDYRMYLAKDNIFYICKSAKIEKTGNKKGNKIYSIILSIRNEMEKNINQVIPQPQAALANGLLFGGDDRLSEGIKENFSKTGMTHIVAVSGYNVTIIAEYLILLGIFLGFWRKQAFWFALAGIFLFVAMIGFPSSAVRAGIMGSLLLWAMKNGRLSNSLNAIILAGAIMLLVNPLLLRWDIGFQLSFLATLGIIILAPLWESVFIKKYKALGLVEIMLLTLSAQIFVLPIIFHNFGIISFVSFPANILILPIIPITMLLVFLTAIAGFIFGPISIVFAWLAYLPLKYEVWVVESLAGLSWASREVSSFGLFWILGWYVGLGIIILAVKKYKWYRRSTVVDSTSTVPL